MPLKNFQNLRILELEEFLKVLIPVLISGLHSESLNISIDIKTAILKSSLPVSISRLQSCYQDFNLENVDTRLNIKIKFSEVSISIFMVKPSLAHHFSTLRITILEMLRLSYDINFPTKLFYVFSVHSPLRGSVKCQAPSMENGFQVAIFLFEV